MLQFTSLPNFTYPIHLLIIIRNKILKQIFVLPPSCSLFSFFSSRGTLLCNGSDNWDILVTSRTTGWFARATIILSTFSMIRLKCAYCQCAISVCLSVRTSSVYNCITPTKIFISLIFWSFINICKHVLTVDCCRIRIKKTVYEKLRVCLCMHREYL